MNTAALRTTHLKTDSFGRLIADNTFISIADYLNANSQELDKEPTERL